MLPGAGDQAPQLVIVERERTLGSIEDTLREAAEACEELAARKDIEVSTTTAGPLTRITMDRLRLVELFVNLIENAIHHTPAGGRIDISAAEVRVDDFRAVLCSVKDTGSGLGSVDPARVFEPFYTTKGMRGCGFGLSVCWSIAQRLGGEVEAESEPGKGSTFTLWLPPAAAPETTEIFDHTFAELPDSIKLQRDTRRTSGIGQDPTQLEPVQPRETQTN